MARGQRIIFISVLSLFFAGGLVPFSAQSVDATLWVGTADYKAAPTSPDDDEDNGVGAFDEYDFAKGVVLLQGLASPSVNDENDNYFQTFVSDHSLSGVEVTNDTNLNSTYELTVASQFTTKVTSVAGGNTLFDLTAGSIDLYFDTTPDHSYTGDSGFNNDDLIISGSITGGSGYVSGGVIGFNSILFDITSFDANVFEPDTLAGGTAVMTLQNLTSADFEFLSGITTVQGKTKGDSDLLMAADGNMSFTIIPETSSLLLIGSGLLGILALRRYAMP